MTEETKLFWQFVFEAMTAVGTVGAVIISLVAVLWRKKRFKVHSVTARADKMLAGFIGDDGIDTIKTSYLKVDVENCLDFPMHVFDARIHVRDGRETVIAFDKRTNLIPAMGRYNTDASLPMRSVRKNEFKNPKKIKITIGTSFGSQTLYVNNPETLRHIMESEDEYTTINTGRRS